METPDIHARKAGEGPAVLLLHGLFGSGANLGALARSLSDAYTVYSLDLPNHGRSAWLPAPDLKSMAGLIVGWMGCEGLTRAHLVGHSLGGKVAMQLALDDPGRVASLVIADIAPVDYPPQHDEVFAALAAVADKRCANREDAAAVMAAHVQDDRVIQFLLTSLARGDDGSMDWRFDREGLARAYPALSAAPGFVEAYSGPALFVAGGESNYIQSAHWPEVTARFPEAAYKSMPGCGHWLHAEKPDLFNSIVARFLRAQEQRMLGATDGEEGASA